MYRPFKSTDIGFTANVNKILTDIRFVKFEVKLLNFFFYTLLFFFLSQYH